MATVRHSKKACAVNPLKMSQPIGGALAFMGLADTMPILHGSQGCTAFGMVLFVRHFKESIPLQTTAMSEVATVLGGFDNVEQAVMNIYSKSRPAIIGMCSTGLTETKGDDVEGYLRLTRQRHPELEDTALIYVSTPDFKGAFQDGWAATVLRILQVLVEKPAAPREPARVAVLPGCHLTVADIEELREILESFGLDPVFVPDLSGSLDGHVPEDFSPTTIGGTRREAIASLGSASLVLAVGEQMRTAAEWLGQHIDAPVQLFDRLLGLGATDALMAFLAQHSGRPVPGKYRRQRSQLVDAMLDGHFYTGGCKVAIGAEPDLLHGVGQFLAELGCELAAAVTTTDSPLLERLPTEEVLIGDLEDLEARAAGCDLLITHAHGRQMAQRLDIPFLRMGLPIFDRLGAAHRLALGYRGSRDFIFEVANALIAHGHEPHPDDWRTSDAPEAGAAAAVA
ncbi:MAG TPA: nitrogenase iron-molybdenum cofactor biosynthesis protein NifN [Pseudomonadales bacterium]|nr:nitrogenase iron-molybdenum cofactor biosynthesis protein NifN [Pseudomonadales bacterium]HNH71668.1 nitrogenase iron-molybdenum cofactor biosynthesis protein NifN [Pseudomonadales bacterium]